MKLKGNVVFVTDSGPGFAAIARERVTRHPKPNRPVNNAEIMQIDGISGVIDDAVAVSTISKNESRASVGPEMPGETL